jgi:hypothetical protein
MKSVFGRGFWTILLLACLSGGSSAAVWVPIDETYQSPGLRMIYIDSASVRREHDLATLSVLIDWKAMQGGRSPTRFYSTSFTKQFDCVGMRGRVLATTDFYGHMGTGPATPGIGDTRESAWIAVESGSLSQGLWEAACGIR